MVKPEPANTTGRQTGLSFITDARRIFFDKNLSGNLAPHLRFVKKKTRPEFRRFSVNFP
jgi:hypothetical protein